MSQKQHSIIVVDKFVISSADEDLAKSDALPILLTVVLPFTRNFLITNILEERMRLKAMDTNTSPNYFLFAGHR